MKYLDDYTKPCNTISYILVLSKASLYRLDNCLKLETNSAWVFVIGLATVNYLLRALLCIHQIRTPYQLGHALAEYSALWPTWQFY